MEEHRINIMDDQPASAAEQTQPQEQGPVVAGVAERFVALLIDWGVICIPYQLLLVVAMKWIQPDLTQIYWLLAGINVPFILYETIFTSGGRNTLGKWLIGVRVVNNQTGEPLSLGRAFMRTIGYYISAALLLCGFLLAFIDTEHRALHDYLAGSVVIESRHKSWGEKTALLLCGILLMAAFGGYFYKRLFGAGSLTQQRLISQAKTHIEKIGYLEELHRIYYGAYTNDLLRLSILSGDPVQFQRDTQKVLHRKGFRIGVGPQGYKISAQAKDIRNTPVYYPAW